MKPAAIAAIVVALLVAGGTVYWVLRAKRGDPAARGPPEAPPAAEWKLRSLVDTFLQLKSNCSEVDRWVREDAVPLLQQLAKGALGEQEFMRRFVQSGSDLDKRCPAGTYVEINGDRETIEEMMRGFPELIVSIMRGRPGM